MLAYVLWHWKQAGIESAEYETRQRAFHAALKVAPSLGFIESFSVALEQAAWTKSGGEVYEDWYVVADFTSLGLLNEAAVSASRSAPHDAAAVYAAGGTAGLYGLQAGSVLQRPQYAYWFGKPNGVSYRELAAQLHPLVEQARGALWMRQMVLGPTAEFCVHAESPFIFPANFSVQQISLRTIWPHA